MKDLKNTEHTTISFKYDEDDKNQCLEENKEEHVVELDTIAKCVATLLAALMLIVIGPFDIIITSLRGGGASISRIPGLWLFSFKLILVGFIALIDCIIDDIFWSLNDIFHFAD